MKLIDDQKINKKKIRNIIIFIVAFALVGFCIVKTLMNTTDIARSNATKEQLSQTLSQQNAENEKLKEIVNSDNKDEYIKEKSKEKGYTEEGETVYYDSSDSK